MTTPTNPELAEFVAGLLKSKIDPLEIWVDYESTRLLIPNGTMFDSYLSPIIRHLVEEEMERREWKWAEETIDDEYRCEFFMEKTLEEIMAEDNCRTGFKRRESAIDKNVTRAVALAAFKTGEK